MIIEKRIFDLALRLILGSIILALLTSCNPYEMIAAAIAVSTETGTRLESLIRQNKELNAQFENTNSNFWKVVNDEREQRRAQRIQSDQAGNNEQAQ